MQAGPADQRPGSLRAPDLVCRQRQKVCIQAAEIERYAARRLHGVDSYGTPSRFIKEIPPELIEEIRPRIQVSRPIYVPRRGALQDDEPAQSGGVRLGQRVRHGKFGEGIVLNSEGSGAHARVQVNFEASGTKWLVVAYANLELM